MAVPEFQAFMLPVLEAVGGGASNYTSIINAVIKRLALSLEDQEERTAGGTKTRVYDRVYWSVEHLFRAGLLGRPKRGHVVATPGGFEVLAAKPLRIDMAYLLRYPTYQVYRQQAGAPTEVQVGGGANPVLISPPADTPVARIELAEKEIDASLRADLLAALKDRSAAFFEAVVLKLLSALGYGVDGDRSLTRTGGSGDGGVDGIIDEDRLGLDRIYVQAKRFSDASVGAPVIHSFIGALHMRGATKGVLLTTSSFSKPAVEATRANPTMRIVLIDGERLAELMIRHGVGVRTDRTIEIKKIDLDYLEPDEA